MSIEHEETFDWLMIFLNKPVEPKIILYKFKNSLHGMNA